MRTRFTTALLVTGLFAVGCASGQSVATHTSPASFGDRGSSACTRASLAKPLGSPRAGSTVALAKLGAKRVAFVADEDGRAITAVDVDTKKELATTPLGGVPSQLLVGADGLVYTLLRDRSELQVLAAENDSGKLQATCVVPTPPEPVAIAASPDDRTLLVSSGWSRTLRAFDARTLARLYDVPVAREPRAVVVSDDGTTAFVAHAVGANISAVDLRTANAGKGAVRALPMRGADADLLRAIKAQHRLLASNEAHADPLRDMTNQLEKRRRHGAQGFALAKSVAPAGRILAPQVLVDPGDPERRPEGYGDNMTETQVPSIAVIDERAGKVIDTSLMIVRSEQFFGPREARDHRPDCLLPRAAAVDPRTHTLLVACFGIDTIVAYDSASPRPQGSERRRFIVGSGPTGIVVDPEQPRAYVWSQFDRALNFVALDGHELVVNAEPTPRPVPKLAIGGAGTKLPTEIALGRILFHSGHDNRISKDGRACASCHPDGRDDGLTWSTPDGPRRSILLAGRVASSSPYAWSGSSTSLHEHIGKTFDRLEGTGLRSLELDALIAYITSLEPPARVEVAKLAEPSLAKGKAIFESKETGCATCHVEKSGFADGMKHDVGSRAKADKSASFDTPSLRLIGGTGPYFHDGRYADLRTLLRDSDGKMGRTKHLSDADLDALEAYLRTL